jgi:hypothetical protein
MTAFDPKRTFMPANRARELPAADRLTLLRLPAEEAGVAPRIFANAEDIQKLGAHEGGDVAPAWLAQ